MKISCLELLQLLIAVLIILSFRMASKRNNSNSAQGFGIKIFFTASGHFSLNPNNSDFIANNLVFQNVVGTLVRLDEARRRVPYLAKAWHTSSDLKAWQFELHSNLTCENNEVITAAGFKINLERSLLNYSRSKGKSLPVFSHLLGWDKFLADPADGLSGIQASQDGKLEFRFDAPITGDGLLAFLSLPYYGYYCSENFSENQWKDESRLVSSGPYIVQLTAPQKAKLTRRSKSDWPLVSELSPVTADILLDANPTRTDFPSSGSIVFDSSLSQRDLSSSGFTKYHGPPNILFAAVLSEKSRGYFSDLKNRQRFFDSYQEWAQANPFDTSLAYVSYFYPHLTSQLQKRNSPATSEPSKETVKLRLAINKPVSDPMIQYFLRGVKAVFGASGQSYEVHHTSYQLGSGDSFAAYMDDSLHDLRISGVQIGGGLDPWMIKMMFCSRLGVCFPDPSGRICKAVDAFEKKQADDADDVEELSHRFNQILYEDAAVLPIAHSSHIWWTTADLKLPSLAPMGGVILLDHVRGSAP